MNKQDKVYINKLKKHTISNVLDKSSNSNLWKELKQKWQKK
jgi:hypothetical protein